MWIEYDRETSHPLKSGIYFFELKAIESDFTITTPCQYDLLRKHIDPILEGAGGWDYSKFKPTHFYLIPERK
jgi:hypothetical protein